MSLPLSKSPGRYLQRVRSIPDPAFGFGPTARIGAGRMVFPRMAAFGPRKQAGYEVILLHDGNMVIEVDGMPFRLQPGEVTLLRPGPYCTFWFSPDTETSVTYVLSYDPTLPGPMLAMLDAPPFTLPASRAMTRLVETLLTLRDTADEPARTRISLVSLSMAVVALFVDEALDAGLLSKPGTATYEHPAAVAARQFIRQRLPDHIGLSDIAEAAHVTPEHLVRVFRAHVGTTPIRLLWAERVRLGVHLLEHTDLPVWEVAARVGCQSPKHFARLIRAEVGAPPRDVRRRSWNYFPTTAETQRELQAV